MKFPEFEMSLSIEEKMQKGIQLTVEERQYATRHGLQGPKLCSYRGCKNPFDPGEGGQYAIAGVSVCSDCYFDSLGAEIELHPIGRFRLRPRGSNPVF